eukprot:scpid86853/ scgid11277/ 
MVTIGGVAVRLSGGHDDRLRDRSTAGQCESGGNGRGSAATYLRSNTMLQRHVVLRRETNTSPIHTNKEVVHRTEKAFCCKSIHNNRTNIYARHTKPNNMNRRGISNIISRRVQVCSSAHSMCVCVHMVCVCV